MRLVADEERVLAQLTAELAIRQAADASSTRSLRGSDLEESAPVWISHPDNQVVLRREHRDGGQRLTKLEASDDRGGPGRLRAHVGEHAVRPESNSVDSPGTASDTVRGGACR
jgi:hypothetical protein